MSDVLDYIPVSLSYRFQEVQANATNRLTLPNGGAGFKVPTGYAFHPRMIHAELDTAVTAQSIALSVAADGVAVSGLSVTLNASAQVAVSAQRPQVVKIAAGAVVSVVAVAAPGFTPTTAGLDVVLSGLLIPV